MLAPRRMPRQREHALIDLLGGGEGAQTAVVTLACVPELHCPVVVRRREDPRSVMVYFYIAAGLPAAECGVGAGLADVPAPHAAVLTGGED